MFGSSGRVADPVSEGRGMLAPPSRLERSQVPGLKFSPRVSVQETGLFPKLPQWLSGKDPACSAGDDGDAGLIPGLGRSPGGGCSNPLQYSCLENLKDRGAWWATVQGFTHKQ